MFDNFGRPRPKFGHLRSESPKLGRRWALFLRSWQRLRPGFSNPDELWSNPSHSWSNPSQFCPGASHAWSSFCETQAEFGRTQDGVDRILANVGRTQVKLVRIQAKLGRTQACSKLVRKLAESDPQHALLSRTRSMSSSAAATCAGSQSPATKAARRARTWSTSRSRSFLACRPRADPGPTLKRPRRDPEATPDVWSLAGPLCPTKTNIFPLGNKTKLLHRLAAADYTPP